MMFLLGRRHCLAAFLRVAAVLEEVEPADSESGQARQKIRGHPLDLGPYLVCPVMVLSSRLRMDPRLTDHYRLPRNPTWSTSWPMAPSNGLIQ
jgi:hypothetical protein